MIERAGIWRRGLAALIDLFMAQVVFQGLVALLFAASAGHVTTGYSLYTACRTADVRPENIALPRGVTLPQGFVPNNQGLCRSSFFGAPTRVLFVAGKVLRQGTTTTTLTQAFPVDPEGRAASRTLDLDTWFLPFFVLLRWASDRYASGSPGRRLARIAVTDETGTAKGAVFVAQLARRYARFAWPLIPAAVLGLITALHAIVGATPPVLSTLNWAAGNATVSAAFLAAALSILRYTEAFYDAPVGTLVAPRSKLGQGQAVPSPGPTKRRTPWSDARAAILASSRSLPWFSLGLFGAMVAVYAAEAWFPSGPSGPQGAGGATLILYGGMDRELVLMMGQIHRLLTAIFVHGSVAHLVSNGFALLVAGWLLEDLLGRALFGSVFLAGGLAASLVSIGFNAPQQVGVGSSGAIQALLAVALVIGARLPKGSRRAWMWAWPIAVGVPALVPKLPVSRSLVVDLADHVGGTIAGLVLGSAIAFLWRDGHIRTPGRRATAAAAGLVATASLLSVAFAGWRDPALSARLVPVAEMPKDDTGWRDRSPELAERYPDDPRPLLGLAARKALDGARADALEQLDRAIAAQRRLSPATAGDFRFTAHGELAGQFFETGDLESAIAQYSLALAENPNAVIFRQRGISEFYRGRPREALADLRQAVAIDDKEAYSVLWLSIVAVRSGAPDPMDLTAMSLDFGAWPGPIVSFLDGMLDAQSLDMQAETLDRANDQHRMCEARFYTGEWNLIHGDVAAAQSSLRAAAEECPRSFIESRAAKEELAGAAKFPAE